ncbi:hypothetical protein AAF712_011589 [Marasmius tenuissimus]|uniref:Purine nucleoside permease n=1 Tax=Marasmius tenuissimus TaxID=585030 RepID=A0ABR2ZLG5_9AGAR
MLKFLWALVLHLSILSGTTSLAVQNDSLSSPQARGLEHSSTSGQILAPKVFIFSMFDPEADVWYNIPEFNLTARTIPVPGFSPLFPDAHCTDDGSVCQLTMGEGEINAAVTVSSLVRSSLFDLTETYFLIAGIAGISPKFGTTGSVTFARYAVQVSLQYELDAREIPSNFTTGYVPQGTRAPGQYPTEIYGTEVFEINDALRKAAFDFAKNATLNDTDVAIAYRKNYVSDPSFAPAAQSPSVVLCDTATSDTFWLGTLLAEAFENTTTLFTNNTATYCTTQQEDNATLEALLRGATCGLVDFSRIIIMRTASDFDRPPPGQASADGLDLSISGGFPPSITNLYLAGVKVVEGIVREWDDRFKTGIKPTNYVGDIFGSLGGTPDFGPGSKFEGKGGAKKNLKKRSRRAF